MLPYSVDFGILNLRVLGNEEKKKKPEQQGK